MEAERVLTAARQHNLFAVDDNASARLMTYASSAIEAVGLSSQSPFAPSVLSGWAEEELRELRSEKRPLLAHMTGPLLLLLHSRQLGTLVNNAFLVGTIMEYACQIGIHRISAPELLVRASGAAYCSVDIPYESITVYLPGAQYSDLRDPLFFAPYLSDDPFSLYVKSSMLLGQVHAFRRRRSAGLSQPGDYELLLARLTVFDEWARSVSDFTEDNLDLIAPVVFAETAMLQLYETTLDTTIYLSPLWELLTRMCHQADCVFDLISSRRCRPGDIDGFTLWCWTVAGLMAADMDEYLRRCTIQSISALWTTVRCNFGRTVSALGSFYPVAQRLGIPADQVSELEIKVLSFSRSWWSSRVQPHSPTQIKWEETPGVMTPDSF
ncbi:hypothetical protein EHS25_007433 [Saitozyma podzolica]|uniref:Transcription factor domain-containing protein n=1 Tax=Saitozyma podzolica TaxID=1890683 RepID=A0A427YPU7_9TREE|nr:hypothetical protein EHS25_007433 [Saitozyma podzolica]